MGIVKRLARVVIAVLVVSGLSACTATRTDDYNFCAMTFGAAGLGAGLAATGVGAGLAGVAAGAGLGYIICDEEQEQPEEPVIEPVVVATAAPVEEIGDDDNDGVKNDRDECPNTPAGVEVDYKGCAKPLVYSNAELNFEFDSADLDIDAATLLAPAIEYIERYTDAQFEIAGHTDSMGSDDYNQALSVRRAQAVADKLIELGIDGDLLSVVGYGETMPVSSNETDSGRARNRRVEVRLLD